MVVYSDESTKSNFTRTHIKSNLLEHPFPITATYLRHEISFLNNKKQSAVKCNSSSMLLFVKYPCRVIYFSKYVFRNKGHWTGHFVSIPINRLTTRDLDNTSHQCKHYLVILAVLQPCIPQTFQACFTLLSNLGCCLKCSEAWSIMNNFIIQVMVQL